MYLSQKNVGSFYFTSDTMVPDSNPWDILPDYFPDLVNAILCTKTYLPIVVSQP